MCVLFCGFNYSDLIFPCKFTHCGGTESAHCLNHKNKQAIMPVAIGRFMELMKQTIRIMTKTILYTFCMYQGSKKFNPNAYLFSPKQRKCSLNTLYLEKKITFMVISFLSFCQVN